MRNQRKMGLWSSESVVGNISAACYTVIAQYSMCELLALISLSSVNT